VEIDEARETKMQRLVGLAEKYDPRYVTVLEGLRNDTRDNHRTLLGFERAPAATRRHHAYEGGLVGHLTEMWDFYLGLRAKLTHNMKWDADVLDARVYRGIINHDLHKAYHYYELLAWNPWKCKWANSDTQQLLTDNHATLYVLGMFGVHLDLLDRNVLLNSEGGWCEKETYEVASVAKLVYLLDELSGNVYDRVRTGTHIRQNVYDNKTHGSNN